MNQRFNGTPIPARGGAAPVAESFAERLGAELGTDPEALLQRYREQVEAVHQAALNVAEAKSHLARLASRFGGRGQQSHFDFERKAQLAEIMEGRRAELLKLAGDKEALKAVTGSGSLSEAYLDNYAHAHPVYLSYLETARAEMKEYEERSADLSRAFANLDHEKGAQSYLEARLQMVRALSFAWGAEGRLG